MALTQTQLEAKVREGSGKGSARKSRANGLIPAIVYGKHLEKPLQIAVDPKAVKTFRPARPEDCVTRS